MSNNIDSLILVEHRCSCGKLLFKGLLLSSALEIKCKGCGQITIIGNSGNNMENKNQYSMLFDDATNLIDASLSATEILGFSRQELFSKKSGQLNFLFKMHINDRLWKTARTLNFESFIFETIHLKKSGEVVPVKANVKFIKSGAKVLALAMFECIPPQSQELEYQNMGSLFVADVNFAGIYTYINRVLITLLGYSMEEMLGEAMFKFYPKDSQAKLKKIFFHHLKLKQSFKLSPQKMVCKNGDDVNLENYFVANVNDLGLFQGYHIIMSDLKQTF